MASSQQVPFRFVPAAIADSKRIAKLLHDCYPQQPLSYAQKTLAQVYGFSDWHHLEAVVRAGEPSTPYDEDVTPSLATARWQQAAAILQRNYRTPTPTATDDLFDATYANAVAQEVAPTARERQLPPYEHEAGDPLAAEVYGLAQRISGWLRARHHPAGPLADMVVNPRQDTSLLRFLRIWGALSEQLPDIPLALAVYGTGLPATVIAFRELRSGASPQFLALKAKADAGDRAATHEVFEEIHRTRLGLLRTQSNALVVKIAEESDADYELLMERGETLLSPFPVRLPPAIAERNARQPKLVVYLTPTAPDAEPVRFECTPDEVALHHGVEWATLNAQDRMSMAEDYALWAHARRWGNDEEFLVDLDPDSDPVPLPPEHPTP